MSAPLNNTYGKKPTGSTISGKGRICIDLGEPLKARAQAGAGRFGETLSDWVRAAVLHYLEYSEQSLAEPELPLEHRHLRIPHPSSREELDTQTEIHFTDLGGFTKDDLPIDLGEADAIWLAGGGQWSQKAFKAMAIRMLDNPARAQQIASGPGYIIV